MSIHAPGTSIPPVEPFFIGLMSGTSLDGVDGVLAAFSNQPAESPAQTVAHAHIPFSEAMRADLMALQVAGDNEIDREAIVANALAECYARCVAQLLEQSGVSAGAVCAVGVHGQTIRHRPELGYSRQANNASLLAELCRIDVVADFRSRDIAAGGQGAPLVPAFHHAVFGSAKECRVIANIGGIANITVLAPGAAEITGYDTGPGNVLMDLWIKRQRNEAFDAGGAWAASGAVVPTLLARLASDPYFTKTPPKSTGRDLFHQDWLSAHIAATESKRSLRPEDVQRTLCELTATTLADAINSSAPDTTEVFVCGGGAFNTFLMQQIQASLHLRGVQAHVGPSGVLGIKPDCVESLAFAWLARQFTQRLPGNLPAVTGASGPRVLGALYPA